MKINIIMPTYNDAKTIEQTLDSIINQTYDNWHLTIVNDGGNDNTEQILKKYINTNKLKEKITYIWEENSDQLNAIKKGLSYINDDSGIVYVCHSDDLIDDKNVFLKVNDYFQTHKVDAIISNLNIINENSEFVGIQKVRKYKQKKSNIALQALWLGRNLFVDVAFWQISIFRKKVYENYLTWNMPFWVDTFNNISMLNVQNVDFSIMKYRISEDNYINNELGILNVLNGELRTAINILKNINIVSYKLQYYLFRAFNKLHIPYHVIYTNKESKHIDKIVKFIVNKRITDENLNKYPYYLAIINFFNNYKKNNNQIILKNLKDDDLFYGSDMRSFNKLMLQNKLPKIYYELFKEMQIGFSIVETTEKDYDKVIVILKFLDIFKYVDVVIK